MAELIVKSALGIAVSYLLYILLIRDRTRLKWIRIYFMVSVAASLVIPVIAEVFAIRQQTWIQIPEEYIREFLNTRSSGSEEVSAIDQSSSFSFANLIVYIYLTGVFIVLSRFLAGFFHLLFLSIKHGIQKVGTDRLVIMHDLPYPFSFLHLIFINRQTLSEGSNGAMLQHERVHIRQWHSLDLILLELLVAFQWFNPFAWFFRRSVKELHEYLADEEVLRHQQSTLDYQLLLFNQACGTGTWKPVNGFSSLTKKRILMINNKRNKKWFAVCAAIVVAIFAIQTFSRINFAQDPPKDKKAKQAVKATNVEKDSKKAYPPPPPPPSAPLPGDEKMDVPPPPPPPPPPPFPFFSGTNDFDKSNEAFADFITRNVQLPEKFRGKDKVGVFMSVTFDNKGKVSNVEKTTLPNNMGFETGPDKTTIVDDPDLINAVIAAIRKAPDFTLQKEISEDLNKVVYAFTFQNNTCKLIPIYYSAHSSENIAKQNQK